MNSNQIVNFNFRAIGIHRNLVWFLCGIGLSFSASMVLANTGPTLYGQLNKELRYLSQPEAQTGQARHSYIGLTDVAWHESFLGVKGSFNSEDYEFAYKLEMAMSSAQEDQEAGDEEMLSIRAAIAEFRASWGTLKFGKDWLPDTIRMMQLDPLQGTGGQLLGLDGREAYGFIPKSFGIHSRERQDYLAYHSPSLSGISFIFAQDRQNRTALDKGNDALWYTNIVAYDDEFVFGKINFHLSYALKDDEAKTGEGADEYYWQSGIKYTSGDFMASLVGGVRHLGRNADAASIDHLSTGGALAYTVNDWTYALSYGMHQFADIDVDTITNLTGYQQQLSLGFLYRVTDKVQTRFLIKQLNRMSEKEVLFVDKDQQNQLQNTAYLLMAGMNIWF